MFSKLRKQKPKPNRIFALIGLLVGGGSAYVAYDEYLTSCRVKKYTPVTQRTQDKATFEILQRELPVNQEVGDLQKHFGEFEQTEKTQEPQIKNLIPESTSTEKVQFSDQGDLSKQEQVESGGEKEIESTQQESIDDKEIESTQSEFAQQEQLESIQESIQPKSFEQELEATQQEQVEATQLEPIEQEQLEATQPKPIEQKQIEATQIEPIEQEQVEATQLEPIDQEQLESTQLEPIEQEQIEATQLEPIEQEQLEATQLEPTQQDSVEQEAESAEKQIENQPDQPKPAEDKEIESTRQKPTEEKQFFEEEETKPQPELTQKEPIQQKPQPQSIPIKQFIKVEIPKYRKYLLQREKQEKYLPYPWDNVAQNIKHYFEKLFPEKEVKEEQTDFEQFVNSSYKDQNSKEFTQWLKDNIKK